MPVNVSILKSMMKNYGAKKGKRVYFASENAGKPAFKKGLATAKKEGHTAPNLKSAEHMGSAYKRAMADQKTMSGIRSEMHKRMAPSKRRARG